MLVFLAFFVALKAYNSTAGISGSISSALDSVKYIVGVVTLLMGLLSASLYISRLHDNDHFLKGAEGLEVVPINRVHSDKRDTLLSFFSNGTGAYSNSEIATSEALLLREAVGDADSAIADEKIAIVIRGEEASGKTVLLWQVGFRTTEKSKLARIIRRRIILASPSKLGKSTFESLYRRLYASRSFMFSNYFILFDDFDSSSTPVSQIKGYLEGAISQEKKYRNSWLGSRLPWGRVTYVVVSHMLEFDKQIQATIDTKFLLTEEQKLLSSLNESQLRAKPNERLQLREFWLKVGGRRSYEGNISSFIANYLLVLGRQRDMLPDDLENSPSLKLAAKFFSAFTMLSMPVPSRLIPKDISDAIEKHKPGVAGKIFVRTEIDGLQGVRLRLKPWAAALLGTNAEDIEPFLVSTFGETIASIGTGATSASYVEWARTLLHRLHKRRHIGLIEFDGETVGDKVVQEHIDLIRKWVASEKQIEALCFWAGTISSIRNASNKIAYPDILMECIRRVAISDTLILNSLPKAFISLAKAITALRHLPGNFDEALADGATAQASNIFKSINIDEVLRSDFSINSKSDWQFRYSQSILSYFKWRRATLPKRGQASYFEKYAHHNRDLIEFIENLATTYEAIEIRPTASLLALKAKAQLDLGFTETAISTYTQACQLVTGELREWGEAGLSIHRDRARAILRHRPEDGLEIVKTFITLFNDLSNHSDFIAKSSFIGPFEDFLNFCEQQPEVVRPLLGDELFRGAAGTCLDRFSEGSLIASRYESVMDLCLKRIKFPKSVASGTCIQQFLVGLHRQLEEGMRERLDKDEMLNRVTPLVWGSGLKLEISFGAMKLSLSTDCRGVL